MGYRIDYVPDLDCNTKRIGLHLRPLIAAGILCFSLAVKSFWPEGSEQMRSYLLSEHMSRGQTSVLHLITDLREGVEFREALTAFCLNILNEEKT